MTPGSGVWIWLTFGVVQVIITVSAAALWLRGPRERGRLEAAVLVTAGILLLIANGAWFWTGGPEGLSPIGMRGGLLGARLSMVTAAEVALLGFLVLVRRS